MPLKFFLASTMFALLCTAFGEGAGASVWLDPSTKKIWMAADSGSGVSLSQSKRYCENARTAGFNNWTLASIDNLQGLFGGAGDERGYHVRGLLKLSGWEWSSTPGIQEGEGWALDFGDGGRASVAAGDSGLNRALCVRTASK